MYHIRTVLSSWMSRKIRQLILDLPEQLNEVGDSKWSPLATLNVNIIGKMTCLFELLMYAYLHTTEFILVSLNKQTNKQKVLSVRALACLKNSQEARELVQWLFSRSCGTPPPGLPPVWCSGVQPHTSSSQ